MLDLLKTYLEHNAQIQSYDVVSTLLVFEKNPNIFQILWEVRYAQFIKIIMHQHRQFKALFLFDPKQRIAKWYDAKNIICG